MPLAPYIKPHVEFLLAWGKKGSLVGEFNSPEGVAVDSLGNVYVADFANQRVQKFDDSGAYITEISGIGNPADVAVDSSGNVYVVDNTGNRILKFDSSMTLEASLGSFGTGDYQFNGPYGVAVDSSGDYVYVTDNGNNRILKYASSLTDPGSYLTQWGAAPPAYTPGTGNGQFNSPARVAVNNYGYVYVTDSGNNRVQKFDSSGDYVTKWGSFGSGDGQFNRPVGVAVCPLFPFYPSPPPWNPRPGLPVRDAVVIADFNNNRVQLFWTATGATTPVEYMTQWGSRGSADGQFNEPSGVACIPYAEIIASLGQYIVDLGNNRVQKFVTLLYHAVPL